jgi:two-component system phosphate regulon sensor histidine kinase PhoR
VRDAPEPTNDGTPRERELQRANDFHAVLLAMAGHDLRQPLQVIMNAYDWLSRRLESSSEKEYLRRGDFAIAQLTKQLDLLVDALRLHQQAAKVMPVPVPLVPMLIRLHRDHEELASRKGLTLRMRPTDVAVMSDPVLLEVTVRNLIRNALKYTGPGGQVLVGSRRRGSRVRIEIHDTGIGIPPDKLARVFDAFHRLDSNQTDGLGLGLFVVRRAVDLLGHSLEVRSTVGHGSCFSILAEASTAVAPRSDAMEISGRPLSREHGHLRVIPVEPPASHCRHSPFVAGDKIVTSRSF